MTIIVTGAAGFIGSNLVKALKERGVTDIEGMTLFTRAALDPVVETTIARCDVPAQAREVFDVTGAGDTVIATLASLLAAQADLHTAVDYANRAGGIVVGKFGTSVVTGDELFGP